MKANSSKFHTPSITLLLVLAGIVYSLLWADAPYFEEDTKNYVEIAEDWRDGTVDEFHYRTPGYPLLLVITNSLEPTRTIFLVQLLMYFLAVFFLASFLGMEGVPSKFILLFLFLALLPQSVVHVVSMLTESMTIFAIATGSVGLFHWIRNGKWQYLIITGLAFAFSAIVRPTYQFLFVVLIGVLTIFWYFQHQIRKKLLISAGLIFLSWCLIVGGLSTYNYEKFGYFGLSPVIGFNLSTKTSRVLERLPDEYIEVREFLIKARNTNMTAREGDHKGEEYIWAAAPQLQQLTGLNEIDLANYMLNLNVLLIKDAPMTYIEEVSRAMSTYWLPTSTMYTDFGSKTLQLVWKAFHFVVIAFFLGVSATMFSLLVLLPLFPKEVKFAVLNSIKPYDSLVLPFFISLAIILYTMLVTTMVEIGNPRHRSPTDLLIFFSMTIGIYFLSSFGSKPDAADLE